MPADAEVYLLMQKAAPSGAPEAKAKGQLNHKLPAASKERILKMYGYYILQDRNPALLERHRQRNEARVAAIYAAMKRVRRVFS